MSDWPRAILHVDMDAFFASVEQHDDPALRGKPVIVGGPADGRGVVSAASYEARTFGVHSAMPTARARMLCPQGIFLRGRMDRYCEVSEQIQSIFARYTPKVRPLSIDEAFLDITGSQRLFGSPESIAAQLKQAVYDETGLRCSAGIAPTMFVAKVASDLEKPDGLVVITADAVVARLAMLPVSCIWGVGKVMQKKLASLGLHKISDLQQWPLDTLTKRFGAMGAQLHDFAYGRDPRTVKDEDPEKSISNERTFSRDVRSRDDLETTLLALSDKVASRTRKAGYYGKTVQIKVRYDDFSTVTRRLTLPTPICSAQELFATGRMLLRNKTDVGTRSVRLIGIGLSHLTDAPEGQGELFSSVDEHAPKKSEQVDRATDQIRKKLGAAAIGRASVILNPGKDSV